YTVERFGFALIDKRMLIYIHEFQGIPLGNVGFVFFVVYGVSSVMAARIYRRFNKISLKAMLITSFLLEAVLLLIFIQINHLFFI
ncbi:hypothetical protein, partial [Enterococcus faecalis]|uniref:hypothetical protein n=1 Tax=Enterococcus faecalis TaxID=1351 RepID=UPI003D6BBFD8